MPALILLAVVIGLSIFSGASSSSSYTADDSSTYDSPYVGAAAAYDGYISSGYDANTDDESAIIDRDTAIDEHWDEIKDYVNGSETVEAYSYDSGSSYDLDADISNGEIDTIHFPNGGYLDIDSDIDSSGDGSGYDYSRGTYWDTTLDMNSSAVDDAVQQWADDNGYELD